MARPHTNGTVRVPPEVVRQVSALVRRAGPNPAARRLGMSRHVVLAVMAGLPVRAGSLALLHERLPRLAQPTPK